MSLGAVATRSLNRARERERGYEAETTKAILRRSWSASSASPTSPRSNRGARPDVPATCDRGPVAPIERTRPSSACPNEGQQFLRFNARRRLNFASVGERNQHPGSLERSRVAGSNAGQGLNFSELHRPADEPSLKIIAPATLKK